MADKLTLPKAKFSHELHAAPVDPTMKAAEATTGKLYRVPVNAIKVIPGFNLRVETPDYVEHRNEIRASIKANGFNPKKPLSGYVAEEDGKNVIYVTDGHTRLAAVQEYNADPDTAEKDEITHLPVIVAPKETSLVDLLVELHTANTGRKLTPFEQGVLAKRLIGEDMKKGDIAARLGFTPRYLDDVLLLANADSKVKQHVAAGDVSSTMAIQLLRKDADTAAEKIEGAVKKAATTGKKATKKHTGPKMQKIKVSVEVAEGADMKEIVKAVAGKVREAIPVSEGEDDTKIAAVAGVVNLVIEIPAPEVEKPVKAEKPKAKSEDKTGKKTKVKAGDTAKASKPAKKGKKPAKKKTEAESDLGIDGAESLDEDAEVAVLPPKVASDEGIDEVDI